MKKEEIIEMYGEAAYERHLEQMRAYEEEHREEANARNKKYAKAHPEVVIAKSQEQGRKGGKHYEAKQEYMRTGIQGEKNKIRGKHGKQYRAYKAIIAQDSQIHHEWVLDTSEYRGVALVEKDAHMHGFIDVIEILEGKITLLTEEQIINGGL